MIDGRATGNHAYICCGSQRVVGPRVLSARIWHVVVLVFLDHLAGDVVAELRDLLSDVVQESVARPSPEQHDCVDRYPVEVHGHCQ